MKIDVRNVVGAGAVFAFSVGFLLASVQYPLGTARQMGPGYFPMLTAGIGILVSALLLFRALCRPEGVGEAVAWRPMLWVFAAIFAFGAVLAAFGLLPAVIATILVSAFADRESRPLGTILLAVGFATASWLVFSWMLRLPFPIFRTPF